MRRILFLIVFAFASLSGRASHIVGGDFYYTFITTYTTAGVTYQRYQVNFKVYRDSCATCTALPASYAMFVWKNSTAAPNTWTRVYKSTSPNICHTMYRTNGSNPYRYIPATCISSAHTIEEGIYTLQNGAGTNEYLDLPDDSVDYYIGWGAAARSASINNIINPANTGQASYSKIPKNKIFKNSNPVYLNRPVSFFCVGKTQYFNQNAYDPDGDSLSFSLATPYNTTSTANATCAAPIIAMPPSNIISWTATGGYSATSPLGSSSTVSINSVTGELTIIPGATGFYIYTVVVKEYRKRFGQWVYLCETRRDMQIQTGSCSASNSAPVFVQIIPVLNADTSANQVVTAGDTLCFKIKFRDANGDSLYTSRTGPIFDSTQGIAKPYAVLSQDTADSVVTSNFCWYTQCPHARASSPYIFTFNVADNQCNVTQKTFTILVNPKAVLPPPNLRCVDILNNDSIKLTFVKSSYLKDFDKYYIYRRTGSSGSCNLIDSIADSTITTYLDKNATNALSTSYGYTLRTRSTCSVYGQGCDTVNSIIVTGAKVADHCTQLTWNRHRQNTDALYKIYRTVNSVKTLVGTTRSLTYIKCDCNTAGKFSIEVDDTLISCTSHSNITTQFSNIDTTAPKAIAITRATVNTTTQIQVDFPKSDSADAFMYIIYRSSTAAGLTPFDSIYASASLSVYSYFDNSPINSGPYYYKIQVKDSCGNRSSISLAHSPVDLTGTNANAMSKLNWVKRYVGYTFTNQILQKRTGASLWANYKTLNSTDTFYNDTSVIACGVYYYRLKTIKSTDTTVISYSDSVLVQPFDTIRPNAPYARYITVSGPSAVTLFFDTSASLDTKRYLIYGSTNNGSFVLIDSLTYPTARPISYTWTGRNPQINTYSMYVVARDSCGNNLSVPSITHTHVQLGGTGGNRRNFLNWTHYKGRTPSTYQVQRYEVGSGSGWATIKTLNYPDTSMTDSASIKGCYTYVYRIVSSFSGYTFTSLSDTLSLIPFDLIAPGAPTINYVSVVSNTSNKVVITKSDSPDVNRYEIFFKSATSGWRSAGVVYYPTTNPFTFVHTGLYTPDSNYSYYVKAIDSCGSNFSTASPTHTTIQLRSAGGAMVNFLNWTKYEGWTPTSYKVLRLIGGTWTLVKTLTAADSSWADTANIKCNQPNSYKVYALNIAGDTSYSDTTIVTPYDTIRPAAPFLRSVSVASNTSITITINKVADQDVNRYQVWYATNNGTFSLATTITYPTSNPFTYTQTGLNTLSNTYRYYIVAIDSCSNNTSLQSIIHRSVNLRSNSGAMTNFLYWNRYEGWASVSNYKVLRLVGGVWTLVKTLTGADTAWADTESMKCNQPNSYKVCAFNAIGDSSFSDTTIVTPYDTIHPAAPFLRSVSVVNNSSINIVINKVADQDVNRYQIWYATNNGTFSLVNTITYPSTNPFNYTQTGLNTLSNTYRYYLVAIDSCSNNVSQQSITHRSINLRSTPGAMINFLYWNRYEGWASVSSYNVLRLIGGAWTLVKNLTGADTAWADTASMKCNQPNSYKIYALNSLGDTSYSDTTIVTPYDTIHPAAPFLRSVSVVNNTSIKIVINKVADQDVNRYQIWYATNNGTFSLITTINYPSTDPFNYTQTGLNTLSNTYRYYVVAIDSCSNNVSQQSIRHRSVNLRSTPGAMTNFLYWNRYEGWASVSSYNVLRLIGGTWTLVKNLTGADTAWADTTNLKCNQPNSYKIYALNSLGDTSYSDTTIVTPFDTIHPAAPFLRRVSVVNNTSVAITINKVPDQDVNRYQIWYATNNGTFSLVTTITYPSTDPFTYVQTGLNTLANNYKYYVLAFDSCSNNVSQSSIVHRDIQLSSSPGNLTSKLAWTKYQGFNVGEYRVLRLIGGTWTFIQSLSGADSTFNDTTNIGCNYTYAYRVMGINTSTLDTSYSDTTMVTPFDTIKPDLPVIKAVTVSSNTSVTITWQSSNPDVNKFRIFRKNSLGVYVQIDSVYYATTYTDRTAQPHNKIEYYKIQAVDSCAQNKSPLSIEHRTIKLNLSYQKCPKGIILNWNDYQTWPTGITSYEIYRSDSINAETLIGSVAGNVLTYTDTFVIYSTTFTYRVKAIQNAGAEISWSDSTSRTTPVGEGPYIEYVTVLSTDTATGSIKIQWNALRLNNYVKRSILYYSPSGLPGTFSILLNNIPLSVTSYIHNNLNTKTANNYYYMVSIDSCDRVTDSISLHRSINLVLIGGQLLNVMHWSAYTGWTPRYYIMERASAYVPAFFDLDTIPATDTMYYDFPAPCNVDLFYRIKAVSYDGFVSASDTAITVAIDTLPPDQPRMKNGTVWANGVNRLDYRTADSTDVYGYALYRKTNNGNWFNIKFTQFAVPAIPYTVYDSTANTLLDYNQYVLLTIDSCLNSTPSDTFNIIQLRGNPSERKNLIYWHPFKGYPIDTYQVQKWNGSAWINFRQVVRDTNCLDSPLLCNSLHYYRIWARENNGLRVTISDSIRLIPFDSIHPQPVVINYATVISNTQISLSWKLTDPDAKNYIVQRKTNNGPYVPIITLPNYPVAYIDNVGSTLQNRYSYRIIAYDTCSGNRSDTILFHTAIQLQGFPQNTQNTLNWNSYYGFGNIRKYYIQKYISGSWQLYDSVSGNSNTYVDLNQPCAQIQRYRILTYDTNSVYSVLSDTLNLTPFDTIKPAIPVIRSVSVVNNTSIKISINKVFDTDVNRYQIWYGTNNGSFSLLTTIYYPTTDPFVYTQTGLNTLSNTYRYYVIAIDSCADNASIPSVIHRSINLRSQAGAMTNFLYWNRYEGWSSVSSYHVLRLSGTTWNLVKSLTGADTAWADIDSLKCNQPNSYRIFAVNAASDTSYSDTTTVTPYDTIHPAIPFLRSVSVLSNSSVSITFNKVADPDVDRYQVWYATNNGSFSLVTTISYPTSDPYTVTQTGLNTLSNTYRYYVVAIDSCSNNVSQKSVTHRSINLRSQSGAMTNFLYWNRYEGWSSVSSYHVLRLSGTTWNLVKSLTGADTAWADIDSLKCNQPNSYRIFAVNAASDTSYSDTTTVTPYDTIHPAIPFLRSVSVLSNSSVSITFNKVADPDVDRYQVWYATNNGSFSLVTTIAYPATNPFAVTQTGLNTLSNTYRYYVVAIDSCSNNVSQNSVTHRTMNLRSIGGAMTNFLYWNRYEGWSAVSNYYILRKSGTQWNLIKTLTGADTAWADIDSLKCNQPNSYRIYAINSLNDSSYSDTTMVTPYDTIRPKAPYIRYVTVASASAIQIVFDSVMDQDVDRYQIFESVNGGTFNLITTLSAYTPNPLQYLRTGINALVNHYYYYVVALDSCSNNASLGGPKHGEVEISGVPGNMRSVLKWHPYTGFGTKYYNIQRLIGGSWTTIGSLYNNDTNYVDSLNISCNVGYYYRIQTVDLSNNAYYSLSDSVRVIPYDTIKPVAPLLKYVSVTSSNSVKVKWDLSASGDVKFYEVHRISPTGTDSYVGTAVYTDTLIDNSAPVQQNSYCYYVIAIDSCNGVNRSPQSNILCTMNMQVVVTPGCVPLSHIRWTKCKSFDELPVPEFEVWRTVDGVTWNMIRKVPATDTAYTDSTVSLAKTYCYVIRAFNASNSYASLSDTECVIPELYPSRPAPELDVATVSVSSTTFGKIVLRWKALSSTDTLLRGYRIYHSTIGGIGSFTLLTTIPNPAAITYTHSSINTYSTNHFYFIVAYDKCNFNGDSSVTHQAENISILNGNLAETISWNLYQGYNVKEYEVLKSFNGVNYFLYTKTSSTANAFVDTNVSCGKWYWYRVKAIENGGDNEIAFSDIDSVLAYDTIPPVPIVIKQATVSAISKIVGEIVITYTSNLEKNRSGYKIYRSINGSAYSLLVANNLTTSGLHVYRDQGLNTLDNIYSYYVRVIDSCGNEGIASDIHTAVNVSAVAYNSSNTVTWTGYEGFNNWHYIIERYTSANPTWVAVGGGNISKNIVTWNDSAIVCDVMYYYRIKTFDDDDATASSISDTAGCLGFETYPPNLPIVLRATVTKSGKSKGEIQLDWIHSTSSDASYYQIYRRTNGLGAWSFVAQTGYINTYKDGNLNTTDNVYEYRLTCEDNCRNISAPTALHASINLTTVPGNNRSNLSWTAYTGFNVDQYEVYADGVLIDNLPGTQLTYVDSMLSCDTAVVYQVKALELNGNTQVSYSDTSICTPYDIVPPAPVYTIAVSVEQPENLVKIQWAPMAEWDGDHYNVYRKIGGEGWLRIYSSKSPYETTFTDKGVNAGDTNIYYKISGTDNCYNTSDYGNTSKTILLRGSSERLMHKLKWSTYGVWNAGVLEYDIIKAEDNGLPYVLATVNASDSTYMDTTFTSSIHNYCYYIRAHENSGSYDAISNSNIVCLSQHPVVWIPTAFSPGSSPNLNDIFAPSGFYYEKYEELIYNRWGELMFKSTPDEPGWDGTYKGKPVPMDTYIYIIRVTGYDKMIYEQKGTVIITR